MLGLEAKIENEILIKNDRTKVQAVKVGQNIIRILPPLILKKTC